MTDVDKLKDFAGCWDRFFATQFKRGDVWRRFTMGNGGDGSIPIAEAKLLYKKFGASRDDTLGPRVWELDWKDRPEPILRLSPDLFEAVDGP